MSAVLSNEQRQQLAEHGDKPIPVVDPASQKVYFIIAGELFDRLRPLFDEDEFDIRETYAAQFAALNTPECWDAPGMELYDNYDAHKPKP
jgi:hypothetical protein